jgi:PAP2 superfamily
MKLKMKSLLLIMIASFFIPTGCKKETGIVQNEGKHGFLASLYNADVPLAWFKLAITLSRTTPNTTPPIASRTFGYMGLALYESVVPGMPDNKSIQHQLNGLPVLPKVEDNKLYYYSVSANAALANMTRHMFGNASTTQNFTIDSLENEFNTEFKSFLSSQVFEHFVSADFDRSVSFGQDISDAIYNWSTTDGGDKAYLNVFPSSYVPPVGPGLWVPQPGQAAQHPYWGNNRTFIAGNATSTQPDLPPSYSTDPGSEFYKEELEVYNESINQDPEHRIIALYWAAIPPPTVSVSIMSAVLTDKNADLSTAAESYCKLGMAISDAFVSCYKTKYTYNQERPISFIRAIFNPTWSPLIPTPPFPDYTSAHSVQTGAAARVLADIFGDNTTFTDYSINDLGFAPRTFNKFSDYANEVGLSRIYGGIHLRSSDFVGLDQGDKVGMNVSALHFKK